MGQLHSGPGPQELEGSHQLWQGYHTSAVEHQRKISVLEDYIGKEATRYKKRIDKEFNLKTRDELDNYFCLNAIYQNVNLNYRSQIIVPELNIVQLARQSSLEKSVQEQESTEKVGTE